ncbi:MAG: sugar phosphate nucleotidyltransferase, partial [Bacteroidota bacterium]|nr:sugar phosphate nucleotidyltransferase [Bacteroidota bacterium]
MNEHDEHMWGIVLAGGEGKRVRRLVRERFNNDMPKQYCAFTGTRSMLQHTFSRIQKIIPPNRIAVTVSSQHFEHARNELKGITERNIFVQPFDRETGASILFPLLHICHQDPEATVAIFPSDHFVLGESRLMEYVISAATYVGRHSKLLMLLGVEAEEASTDYGWIEPEKKIAEWHGTDIYRVKRFWEKPSPLTAQRLYESRSLWNTMIMVCQGT